VLPIVNGLEKEYGDRIEFVRVNILLSGSRPLMERYAFSSSPEFYLVDADDRVIRSWDDTLTAESVRAAFDKALKR
jgi:hypothetical protein